MTKIMIVDDEPDFREMLSLMMKNEGYETELAEDGTEFLSKIDEFKPDLITLDVMMPGLTTSEILKKLNGKRSKPKIILLTVVRYSDDEKKQIMSRGNVVDYITKPFDLDFLLEVVKRHVQQEPLVRTE